MLYFGYSFLHSFVMDLRRKRKFRLFIPLLLLTALIVAIIARPRKVTCAYPPYFAQLNTMLLADRPGESAGLIDLDRIDHNLAVVRRALGNDFRLRLVTKSLPSIELLRYLMKQGQTNRLMVFSEPFIATILDSFPADSLDILLGKPLPVDAAARLSEKPGWTSVHWLIDSKVRLQEYLDLALRNDTLIRIALEIDIGLHRGGFGDLDAFSDAVRFIRQHPQQLQLTGLMGYDGHVPYVPFYLNKEKAVQTAFDRSQQRYAQFVGVLEKQFDTGFIRGLTFNSGGTRTYFYYPDSKVKTPVNDIAMGSGFLTPANFPELSSQGHQPALFLCSPILKKITGSPLPHADKLSPLIYRWNPNLEVSYFMLGGGWPGDVAAPAGMQHNCFWDGEHAFSNLLPNQAILSSSDENMLKPGDFVFYQAWEGDGMLCFDRLVLVRQGRITGTWPAFKGGN